MTTARRFRVRVSPGASKNEIVGIEADGTVRVKLTAPPVKGAANKLLVRLLAKKLGVKASSISIATGSKNRDKVVEVVGAEDGCWQKLLPHV